MFLLCGCEKMVTLSEEDEDKIVAYTTALINKFNRTQKRGLVPVVMQPEDEETEPEEELEETTEEEPAEEEQTPADTDVVGTEPEEEIKTPAAEGGESSVTDVIAIPGVSFSYKEIKVSDDFGADGGFLINPQNGNSFVAVTFTASNTVSDEVNCDISAESLNFTAELNGITSAVDRTILPNDLTTYSGSIPAGDSVDLAVLFQFPSSQVSDLSGINLSCIKDGVRYNVPLQ